MNLVRLGMIVALAAIAWYSLSIYAGIPTPIEPNDTVKIAKTVELSCPTITNGSAGTGAILVALVAIGGAITVAGVDLARRVY